MKATQPQVNSTSRPQPVFQKSLITPTGEELRTALNGKDPVKVLTDFDTWKSATLAEINAALILRRQVTP